MSIAETVLAPHVCARGVLRIIIVDKRTRKENRTSAQLYVHRRIYYYCARQGCGIIIIIIVIPRLFAMPICGVI